MPSSSKAPKQTNAVQAGTASSGRLDARPDSPATQLFNHATPVAAFPASSRTLIVHQKPPAAAQSDAAGDPLQPLTQQAITLEQFLELLKAAVVSTAQPQPEPKKGSSALSRKPAAGKETTASIRNPRLECKSIREV